MTRKIKWVLFSGFISNCNVILRLLTTAFWLEIIPKGIEKKKKNLQEARREGEREVEAGDGRGRRSIDEALSLPVDLFQ